jgi:hypothetical protein
MASSYDSTRVVKRLSATQPGAIKLARRFGKQLVCVRYRQDAEGKIRYTTVELVIDQAPVQKKRGKDPNSAQIVGLQISPSEASLLRRIRSNGGEWDHDAHLWRLPRSAAKRLGLLSRVVTQ